MTGFIMAIHVLICAVLIVAILMQAGRGGGLTESFSSAESMFGAHTNEFMIKTTTILSVVFFLTCLGLAILSSKKDQSLMSRKVAAPVTESFPGTVEDVEDIVSDIEEAVEADVMPEESVPVPETEPAALQPEGQQL